ncbi:MAG TPA: transposase, partial [Chitinophagales bacterium]|nr:transposase [Chitinophagales bacterium]
MRVLIFKKYVFQPDRQYIISMDEVVEGKSRDKTFGLTKFWSSILNSPISGICFYAASFIDVIGRKSYMMATEQVVHTEKDKKRIAENRQKVQEGKLRNASGNRLKSGRNKGTKNKPQAPNDTASYRAFSALLGVLVGIVTNHLPGISLAYMVADGKYAAKDYINAIREVKWHLITRLPVNAALQLPFIHPVGVKKSKRKYDKRVDFDKLQEECLKETRYEGDNKIQTYQLCCYNTKICAELLNVVIVKVTHLKTQKVKYATLACTDLHLAWDTIIDYYSLRFQIEFDFREAKQFFGLSDFKNYTRQNVTNFVNLCLTAVLVAKILQQHYQQKFKNPDFSILDLKILFNARFTAKTVIKLLRKSPESIFNPRFADEFMP